jgi:UrcA family protein
MAASDIRTPIWTAAVIGEMVCGAMVFSHAAMAQPGGAAAAPTESQEIVIVAPEVVRRSGPSGPGRWEVASTTVQVNFADLDLAKAEDYAKLRQRIQDAAREACRRIDDAAAAWRTYSEPPGCRARAAMEPLSVAKALADAARSK